MLTGNLIIVPFLSRVSGFIFRINASIICTYMGCGIFFKKEREKKGIDRCCCCFLVNGLSIYAHTIDQFGVSSYQLLRLLCYIFFLIPFLHQGAAARQEKVQKKWILTYMFDQMNRRLLKHLKSQKWNSRGSGALPPHPTQLGDIGNFYWTDSWRTKDLSRDQYQIWRAPRQSASMGRK